MKEAGGNRGEALAKMAMGKSENVVSVIYS